MFFLFFAFLFSLISIVFSVLVIEAMTKKITRWTLHLPLLYLPILEGFYFLFLIFNLKLYIHTIVQIILNEKQSSWPSLKLFKMGRVNKFVKVLELFTILKAYKWRKKKKNTHTHIFLRVAIIQNNKPTYNYPHNPKVN